MTGVVQRVDQASGKRRLRADDYEVEAFLVGKPDDSPGVRDRDRVAVRQRCNPGIAGGAVKVEGWIIVLQLPGDRVFATASADDQCLHRVLILWPL
jgi:hypothetical protein